MEGPKSPDKGIDAPLGRRDDLAAKVANRQAATLVISADRLPLYLDAASATGFKVEKIAVEGEEFPVSREGYSGKVRNIRVQGKGRIAVSVEKPEGSTTDHAPFWDNLRSLEKNKA